jgi:protein-S-isoprenylcysteine O-methyltransferase Ste14
VIAALVFAVGAVCLLVLCAGMVVTIVSGTYRFWPPGDDDRKLRTYLVFTRLFLLSFLVVGVLDSNSGTLPWPERAVPGLVVVVAGVALLTKAGMDLGEEETSGRAGELRTDGLYSYTRNPQNLAYIVFFAGFTVVFDSTFCAALTAGATVFFVLQSLVEEPWLRETYGADYLEYCNEVPRFIGSRSVKRALEQYRDENQ